MPPDPPIYQVLYVYTLAIPPSNCLLQPWMVDFFTCQMLDKIKYDQATVQICTISGIHYWGRCTNCTLSSWSKLYKFVHLDRSVQVCTLLTAREVYKFVHPYQFSFRLISDIHEIVTNRILPKFKANNGCMLNLISVKVCILIKSWTELSDHNMLYVFVRWLVMVAQL